MTATPTFTLILIRGLPGSGKTTVGHMIAHGNVIPGPISADDYMVGPDGAYLFDPARLPEVHGACQRAVYDAMRAVATGDTPDAPTGAVVANTFCEAWEMEPYFRLAAEAGRKAHPLNVRVEVIDLFDAGRSDSELARRNGHGVPWERIAIMRSKYDHNWRMADWHEDYLRQTR